MFQVLNFDLIDAPSLVYSDDPACKLNKTMAQSGPAYKPAQSGATLKCSFLETSCKSPLLRCLLAQL